MKNSLIFMILVALCVFSGCIDPPDPPETDYVLAFDDITPEQVSLHRHVLVDGTIIQYLRTEDTGALQTVKAYLSVFRRGEHAILQWRFTRIYVFSDENGDTMEVRFSCNQSHLIGKRILIHGILCGEYGEHGEGVYLKVIEVQ